VYAGIPVVFSANVPGDQILLLNSSMVLPTSETFAKWKRDKVTFASEMLWVEVRAPRRHRWGNARFIPRCKHGLRSSVGRGLETTGRTGFWAKELQRYLAATSPLDQIVKLGGLS
jgi:hypothetical protein